MRSAGNFHPEWGYLAPAPSFMRSVRTALVATAIGAIAGAVVVVSLVSHPGATDNNSSIAAHALVTTNAPVVAAPTVAALPFGKAAAATLAQTSTAAAAKLEPTQAASAAPSSPSAAKSELKSEVHTASQQPAIAAGANEAGAASATSQAPISAAELPDDASPTDAAVAADTPGAAAAAVRRHRIESAQARRRWQAANNNNNNAKKHWHDNHGLAALFHIFGGPFEN
jgi:hypothetical protein